MPRDLCLLGSLLLLVAAITHLTEAGSVPLPPSTQPYRLVKTYRGSGFFDASNFTFDTENDPTHGYVDYVGRDEALSRRLADLDASGNAILRVDTTQIPTDTARGRKSVRITSTAAYNPNSLFVLDLDHMPTGCATWPAFWLVGADWPNNGEIDIIEGVNTQSVVQTTLHTNEGCSMAGQSQSLMTGHWVLGSNNQPATNCYVYAPNQFANQGCGIVGADQSMGTGFNTRGGGVYATAFENSSIRVWFWPRGQVPSNVQSTNPDPSTWGAPYAYFTLGSQCPTKHFNSLRVVINTTLCGDWAGGVWAASGCAQKFMEQSCSDTARFHPEIFTEAYWSLRSLKVYSA